MANYQESDFPHPPESVPHGLPLNFSSLGVDLHPVNTLAERIHPPVANAETRFLAVPENKAWVLDDYGDLKCFKWEHAFRNIPFRYLQAAFTTEELIRLNWNTGWTSIDTRFEYDHQYHIFWQIANALHHWDYGHSLGPHEIDKDYNLLVRFHKALSRFDFDLGPDFDVRLNHTRFCNERGSNFYGIPSTEKMSLAESDAIYNKYSLWLDGKFGFFVRYKGEHVLTIGFSPKSDGILIHQIQLRQKKGNRWLFHLPNKQHYMDYTLDRMTEAFKECGALWLVEGKAAAEQVVRVHSKKDPVPLEVLGRIIKLYDRPLSGYHRSRISYTCLQITFRKLIKRHGVEHNWETMHLTTPNLG